MKRPLLENKYNEALHLLKKGVSITETARRVGVCRQTIGRWARACGVNTNPYRVFKYENGLFAEILEQSAKVWPLFTEAATENKPDRIKEIAREIDAILHRFHRRKDYGNKRENAGNMWLYILLLQNIARRVILETETDETALSLVEPFCLIERLAEFGERLTSD